MPLLLYSVSVELDGCRAQALALCNEKQQCMGCGVVQRDGYTTRERIGRKES